MISHTQAVRLTLRLAALLALVSTSVAAALTRRSLEADSRRAELELRERYVEWARSSGSGSATLILVLDESRPSRRLARALDAMPEPGRFTVVCAGSPGACGASARLSSAQFDALQRPTRLPWLIFVGGVGRSSVGGEVVSDVFRSDLSRWSLYETLAAASDREP